MKIKNLAKIIFISLLTQTCFAESIVVDLTLPKIDANPYHRPYVAVWVETAERKGVQTIAVWHEKDKWLKDMRQWWRKVGRAQTPPYDSVSSATQKPGSYKLTWDGKGADQKPVAAGEYYINIEAAREEGGRDFLRQKVMLGGSESQKLSINGEQEIGSVVITINAE